MTTATVPATSTAAPLGRSFSYADLKAETTLSRWTIWRRVKDGTFPPPQDIGGGRKAWRESDVEAWKASCPTDST